MSKLVLYHGSPGIIEKPVFGKGKAYNDYGRGFYCTEHIELAKEWACTEGTDGIDSVIRDGVVDEPDRLKCFGRFQHKLLSQFSQPHGVAQL